MERLICYYNYAAKEVLFCFFNGDISKVNLSYTSKDTIYGSILEIIGVE
jgi:hypothetical protein